MADNLKQLITDVVTGLDQSVTELYPLVDSQVVDSAVGVWLDLLGGLVGCKPRTTSTGFQNYTDTQYRKIVKAKIAINNDGATHNNLANVVRYSVMLTDSQDWDAVKDNEVPMQFDNANVFIDLQNVTVNDSDSSSIREFIPAGVGLWLKVVPEIPFIVADLTDTPVEPDEGDGLASIPDSEPRQAGELAYYI